jgi:hypothetical protein
MRKKYFDFNNLLNNHFNQPQHVLCGHNAKEFDIPSRPANDYQ